MRARTEVHDVKVSTPYKVNPNHWESGKVKKHKISRSVDHNTHQKRKENEALDTLNKNLEDLRTNITNAYFKQQPKLNPKWLRNSLNPTPTTFSEYVPVYLRMSNLKPTTEKKIHSTLNRLLAFRDVQLTKVDKSYRRELLEHLQQSGYAHNTQVNTLKVMQTICTHAYDNDIDVHPDSMKLTKKLSFNKPPHVYLNLSDLVALERTEMPTQRLEIARDWLLISCWTGQRVGDLFTFSKKKIITVEGHRFIKIKQSKTSKQVKIPINTTIERILSRYGGEFPPMVADNKSSNEVIYNRLIKKVCKIAGLDEMVEANLRNPKTNRYEVLTVPKWKAVSSHIGRRSLATNYFGKLSTGYIKKITGHKTERQLLDYIGEEDDDDTYIEIARQVKALEHSPLILVSKTN
ncbi:phage integrase SAM-like domain-containing protein [Pukyongia salina]|nr:phage integrase SAM-like domain-containing protein [Pukyongia salina]